MMESLFAEINNLNNDDFERLIDHVDKQKRRRARDILLEAQRQATRFVSDLNARGVKVTSLKSSKPAKYANPKDSSQTWSGFGRAPTWYKEHLTSGGKEEDMAI